MKIEVELAKLVAQAINNLFNYPIEEGLVTFQKTRLEFEGDTTLVVFPFTKVSKKSPEETAKEIGEFLLKNSTSVQKYNVVKGFLNLMYTDAVWIDFFISHYNHHQFGINSIPTGKTIMLEYSSPNTNKPLHLGHIRNNLLGVSVSRLLEANGHKVVKANLINDRGIHICKSMLAWQQWGNGETPELSGMKGDKLVGKYYVEFDKKYKTEVTELMAKGLTKEEAEKKSLLMQQAQEMLRKWEVGDKEVRKTWEMMNEWVYQGFNVTYNLLGVSFDKIYYESNTYLLGKEVVEYGLQKGVLFKKEDGSVWCDLTADGLDQKLLLRSDGTSVYMTQDLGTAIKRFEEYPLLNQLIYTVGNEQDYHFRVLFLILQKLGYQWAKECYHLSYGMVELPEGKMKSREGTVVDADDLIQEMIETARQTSEELGKLDECTEEEKNKLYYTIGLGALKYFILKVDPKKKMLFNPKESIDFNGNTGPFIQYTYARICSILRRAGEPAYNHLLLNIANFTTEEKDLIKCLSLFPEVVKKAAEEYNPGEVANYIYDLAKTYNHFYQTVPILRESDEMLKSIRVEISRFTASVIKNGMYLLGIEVPERM
ncbi:MAG: arginine--tRNA ligase [Bacteroidetes bacterium]|nr:arginine--tRNA ligase [Bacteroidota bacterium]MBV6460767.1 Arginine--tRNA ligase [Flavobacteriales bacterium]WKZ75763.1 MAG: arginine--tRNA ligase [Vicingaceae bacterium]MCL4817299.1 arginine--tRNA ligase [Flavobacteriales bacterium]NOG94717.1 arginine--tRNA ligase [Bacteroidota bacterium]